MKALAVLFLSIFLSAAAYSQARLNPGMAAPQFSATDINGQEVSLNNLQGKVVVLTFWSTRCAICHEELPKVNQMVRGFDGKDVVFLAATTESDNIVSSYLKKNQLNSRILPNSFGVLLSYADRTAGGNLDMGFPAYYVIDGKGTLRFRASGWDKTPMLGANISKLLAGGM